MDILQLNTMAVTVRSLPVGVHLGQLESILNIPATIMKVQEIEKEYKGMILFVGVDDMDMFKGIILKFLAVEQILQMYECYRGKFVVVQIINPPRSKEQDVMEIKSEVAFIAKRINKEYGGPGYTPVVLIDHFIPCSEKLAFYVVADCCIVTAIKDGLKLIPYEYIVCRQGSELMDRARGMSSHSSVLILSEFIGCSQTLSRALRVNPYNTRCVADALCEAMNLSENKRRFHHKIHYSYIAAHDLAYWIKKIANDLEKACEGRRDGEYCNPEIGLGFRVVAYPPDLTELSFKHVSLSYKEANNRAIFLDYDGMIMSESCVDGSPSSETISILNNLCRDSRNTVFVLSRRGRNLLDAQFTSCGSLSGTNHGYFNRWSKASARESTLVVSEDCEWRNVAELVKELYTATENGSYIESKRSSLARHYKYADPEFGSSQAKALQDHLGYIMKNDLATVESAQHTVEVKSQGITKGWKAEKLVRKLVQSGKPPDFIMCIGDDQSDEELFERISKATEGNAFPKAPKIFTCTSCRKPTNAKYYGTDVEKVLEILQFMADLSTEKHPTKELVLREKIWL